VTDGFLRTTIWNSPCGTGILTLQLHGGKTMWGEFENIRFKEIR
jgi:hypothetical protein